MNKKLIIALIILSLLGGGIFYLLITRNIGTKYNTAEVKKTQVEKYLTELGIVASKSIRTYYGNSISKVESMDLQLGDYVKKGQLLIKFEDNVNLESQIIKNQIAALRASSNEAVSGPDIGSINIAQTNMDSIKNNMDFKNKNKEKIEKLYGSGALAESELKQIEYELEQLEYNLSVAEDNYNQLIKAPSKNIRARYNSEIAALNNSLKILENTKGSYVIYADFDGIVTDINTFVGDSPSAGIKILEIMDPLEKNILVDFLAKDALLIRPNMKAQVDDENLGIQITGINVQKIHPKSFISYSDLGVEENRQTIELNFPKTNKDLPFGLKVEIKVMIEEPRLALFIPEDAVYERDLKKYVELLIDKKVVERQVVTGIEDKNFIEIKEGLKEGENVILHYKKK